MYKEVRGLHQAAYVLAIFTFGSQILALVRDRLLAHQFGAGTTLDLYYAAFRIPDLLYVLFASTLSVYVLIPFVAERIDGRNSERAQNLLSQIFSFFLIIYIILALGIGIFMPYLVPLIFPGFVEHTSELVLLVRILLLQPLLLGLSSLLGVITQLGHRFVLYAISPLLYNAGIICGVLFLYPIFGLEGLAYGVIIGAFLHLAIQMPFVVSSELMPKPWVRPRFAEIRGVLTISLPRALTLSLHQIVLLGLVSFASLMSIGSVSVFQFAFNLQSVPLAIIGVSYSVAAFPMLAQLFAEQKMNEFRLHITSALRHIMFWSLPLLALIIVIRAQFVRVVLGSGAFNWNDTRLTAAVLALFAFSLLAQGINLLLVRALYAAQNTRIPFYITLVSAFGILACSFFSYAFFVSHEGFRTFIETIMRVQGVPGTEVLMLALGYSVALLVHSIVLLVLTARKLGFKLSDLTAHFLRALLAAILSGTVAYSILNLFVSVLETQTLLTIFLQGMLAGVLGIITAGLTYFFTGSPEVVEIYNALRKRLFKTDIVPVQDEDSLSV